MIPIYKAAQEGQNEAVDSLLAKHPSPRRTHDGKHIIFCEAQLDAVLPYVLIRGEDAPAINEQEHFSDWLALEDSEHAFYVNLQELRTMDKLFMLDPEQISEDI